MGSEIDKNGFMSAEVANPGLTNQDGNGNLVSFGEIIPPTSGGGGGEDGGGGGGGQTDLSKSDSGGSGSSGSSSGGGGGGKTDLSKLSKKSKSSKSSKSKSSPPAVSKAVPGVSKSIAAAQRRIEESNLFSEEMDRNSNANKLLMTPGAAGRADIDVHDSADKYANQGARGK